MRALDRNGLQLRTGTRVECEGRYGEVRAAFSNGSVAVVWDGEAEEELAYADRLTTVGAVTVRKRGRRR